MAQFSPAARGGSISDRRFSNSCRCQGREWWTIVHISFAGYQWRPEGPLQAQAADTGLLGICAPIPRTTEVDVARGRSSRSLQHLYEAHGRQWRGLEGAAPTQAFDLTPDVPLHPPLCRWRRRIRYRLHPHIAMAGSVGSWWTTDESAYISRAFPHLRWQGYRPLFYRHCMAPESGWMAANLTASFDGFPPRGVVRCCA